MGLNELSARTWSITLCNSTVDEMDRIYTLMKDRCIYINLRLTRMPTGHIVLRGYIHLYTQLTRDTLHLLLGKDIYCEPVDQPTDIDTVYNIRQSL